MTGESPQECARCGAENREGALFCALCGTPLGNTTETSLPDVAERGSRRRRAGLTVAVALAFAALLGAWLVQRAELRSTDRELAAIVERLDDIDAELATLGDESAELRERVREALERTRGTEPLAVRILPSVFSLEAPDGSAAGFAAWREGGTTVLLTAAHVVSGWRTVTVRRGGRSWKGEVLEVDSTNDLATVRVPGRVGEPLWQEPERTLPAIGATLVLFGSPLGYEGTVTRGIVSRVAYNEIQTDAPANPGSSGGPALTEDGRLVGVVVSGYEGRDITFVVPVRRVCVQLRAC